MSAIFLLGTIPNLLFVFVLQKCEYSFYPVLRCLVPGADNARGNYGIQLTTMGRLYIKVLNLAPNGEYKLFCI